jgi:Flp pilus assembly protein TadD
VGGLLSDGDNNPRLKALRTFAEQRPQDPFPRYALGMELKSGGDAQGAWATFEALIVEHPDYIACYAPAGEVLVVLGRIDDARAVYGKGIEACVRIGNPHMRANLEDVLAALGE